MGWSMIEWIGVVVALVIGLQYVRSLPLMWHGMLLYGVFKGLFIESKFERISDKVVCHRRVMLDDMDLNMHMNNSCYFKYCDINLYHLAARSGIASMLIWKRGYKLANGGVFLQFKSSLTYLEAYRIESYIDTHDDRWVFIRHDFLRPNDDRPCAVGFSKLIMKNNKREDIPPSTMLDILFPRRPTNISSSLRSASLKNIEEELRKPFPSQ